MNTSIGDYYWFWLCNISGIGNTKIRNLLLRFDDAKSVYNADFDMLIMAEGITKKDAENIINSKKDENIYNEFIRLKDLGIRFVHIESEDYPCKLKEIYDYPIGLYVLGKLPENDGLSIAIIGSRTCTEYGKNIAYMLSQHFSNMGINVISGMASGIDAAGHRGCIDVGGKTYAVLGCGVDVCYPRGNIDIYREIQTKGGLISEYPPGTKPWPGQFPVRNRIISALADVVIVVEAKKKSGSLITVDQALEQNKEIMAVPGRIGDILSEGCNELIKMGAMVITKPEDILQSSAVQRWLYNQQKTVALNKNSSNYDDKNAYKINTEKINTLAYEKNMLYSLLSLSPKNLDDLVIESGLDIQKITEQILIMQIEGSIKEVGSNSYIRTSL